MNRSKSFLFPRINHPTRLGPTGRLPRKFPYAPTVNSVFPPTGSFFTTCFPNRMPPLDLSLNSQKKSILRSSFVHYPPPQLLPSGTLCVTSHPTPNPTEWKGSVFSAALQSSSLRLVYIITTQFLRSSFFILLFFLTKGPLSLLLLPPHVGLCVVAWRARMAFMVWFGFRQSESLDCSSRTIPFRLS
jgi:hypothetical protein